MKAAELAEPPTRGAIFLSDFDVGWSGHVAAPLGVLDAHDDDRPHLAGANGGIDVAGDVREILFHPAIGHVQHRIAGVGSVVVARRRVDVDASSFTQHPGVDGQGLVRQDRIGGGRRLRGRELWRRRRGHRGGHGAAPSSERREDRKEHAEPESRHSFPEVIWGQVYGIERSAAPSTLCLSLVATLPTKVLLFVVLMVVASIGPPGVWV